MMEDCAQAGFLPDRLGNSLSASRKNFPFLLRQAMPGEDAAGVLRTFGDFAVIVRQDDEGKVAFHSRQQARRADSRFYPLSMRPGILEHHGHKSAQQPQPTRMNFSAQLLRVCGHESPVAQFGALVAGLDHLVEHPGVSGGFPLEVKFQYSPGTGRVCNFDHDGSLWIANLRSLKENIVPSSVPLHSLPAPA